MKKTIVIFGVFVLITIIWSIIFNSFIDKSIPAFRDLGVLEVPAYLAGILIGNFPFLILSIVIYLILIILRNKKKIKLDDKILFFLGLSLIIIFEFLIIVWLSSKLNIKISFDIEFVTGLFYVPLVYSLVVYNSLFAFLKKNRNNK